ncbi:hypothetical protein F9L69_01550 [Brucella melitensis]|uniref:Transposase n=1 Tax=Brucella melitensis TaxID=29459 RepID=A0AB36PSL9_BRUML|nr:hypothetical protein ADS42_009820 [Brucella melitensis]RTQ39886.1 hypothetical protein EJW28_12470 [Brucella abortus]ARX99228.1 hypothetical protein BK201_05320 [Brucella melitensis]ARY02406.1 hypothetical protein BK186_05325 [Brucella melitensis]ARY05588.1 hypothetical protein BK218_05325 [Brucella melitensis]
MVLIFLGLRLSVDAVFHNHSLTELAARLNRANKFIRQFYVQLCLKEPRKNNESVSPGAFPILFESLEMLYLFIVMHAFIQNRRPIEGMP